MVISVLDDRGLVGQRDYWPLICHPLRPPPLLPKSSLLEDWGEVDEIEERGGKGGGIGEGGEGEVVVVEDTLLLLPTKLTIL